MPQVQPLDLPERQQQRTAGSQGANVCRFQQRLGRGGKLGLHGLPRRVQVKKFCPLRVDAAAQPVLQQDKDLLAISSIAAQQRFRWAEPGKLREHPVTAAVAVELRGINRAGGDIAEAEPPAATLGKETGKTFSMRWDKSSPSVPSAFESES